MVLFFFRCSSCPDIKRIYILIREKKGKDVRNRFEELFDVPVSVFFRILLLCRLKCRIRLKFVEMKKFQFFIINSKRGFPQKFNAELLCFFLNSEIPMGIFDACHKKLISCFRSSMFPWTRLKFNPNKKWTFPWNMTVGLSCFKFKVLGSVDWWFVWVLTYSRFGKTRLLERCVIDTRNHRRKK